ncbi:MAG: amidohydrolase family protein [Bacteroidetes bacterium]|nr:amidohydrolase family protein [Bacteroidota bacterium]MCB0842288.1 amidohydrolase family protein [Bacteroidota bacterium]
MKQIILSLTFVVSFLWLIGQPLNPADTTMGFEEYNPPSTLVVPEHPLKKAKFPFIDVHNHQWRMADMDLNELTDEMDALNMAVMVNLSGRGWRSPDNLPKAINNVKENKPNRFIVFTNISFDGIDDPKWSEYTVKQLENDVKLGAKGLKIFKNLGLTEKDKAGNRIATDDPRLDPIWAKCGELGIPVLIHTGEPAPFWQPRDKNNERWLELKQRPNRYRDPQEYPSWEEVMAEQHNVFRKHPKTIFINAHLGWLGNDLDQLGKLMDEIPNMYTEIGAVLAELGRQPRMAKKFLTKYQDRVMFGKDSWNPEEYYVYFRVLETDDEYFDYYRKRHAFWKMYGLDLSDEVLKKIYYKNALRIIPGIDASQFPK